MGTSEYLTTPATPNQNSPPPEPFHCCITIWTEWSNLVITTQNTMKQELHYMLLSTLFHSSSNSKDFLNEIHKEKAINKNIKIMYRICPN